MFGAIRSYGMIFLVPGTCVYTYTCVLYIMHVHVGGHVIARVCSSMYVYISVFSLLVSRIECVQF